MEAIRQEVLVAEDLVRQSQHLLLQWRAEQVLRLEVVALRRQEEVPLEEMEVLPPRLHIRGGRVMGALEAASTDLQLQAMGVTAQLVLAEVVALLTSTHSPQETAATAATASFTSWSISDGPLCSH